MMIKEYFINNLSKIENDWKRLEIGTEMTSFQTYDWSLLLLKDIKEKLLRSIFWKPVFVCHLNSSGEVDMIAPLVVQSKSLNLRFYSMMRRSHDEESVFKAVNTQLCLVSLFLCAHVHINFFMLNLPSSPFFFIKRSLCMSCITFSVVLSGMVSHIVISHSKLFFASLL